MKPVATPTVGKSMNMELKRRMNTRSRKALSPVVASIILIAVTVAVSIAVAAWMGALTFNSMEMEQLKITKMQFGTPANMINVTMLNTGTTAVTIREMRVNNGANLLVTQFTVAANGNWTQTITYAWIDGAQYEVEMRSSKGNEFTYSATAPI
jgi:flagellin-like protein